MNKNTNYLRQVIVVRKDLCMPSGKLAAMVAHAAMTFLVKQLVINNRAGGFQAVDLAEEEIQWLTELDPGIEETKQVSMAKIVLAVTSRDELLHIWEKAEAAMLTCEAVYDCGYSHNKKGEFVAIAIGPDWPDKINPITGHLGVYR